MPFGFSFLFPPPPLALRFLLTGIRFLTSLLRVDVLQPAQTLLIYMYPNVFSNCLFPYLTLALSKSLPSLKHSSFNCLFFTLFPVGIRCSALPLINSTLLSFSLLVFRLVDCIYFFLGRFSGPHPRIEFCCPN